MNTTIHPFRSGFRRVAIVGVTLLVGGCSGLPTTSSHADMTSRLSPATVDCVNALVSDDDPRGSALDGDAIRVVNWNIQKGAHPDWADDLEVIHGGADILILQEASPDAVAWDRVIATHHRSFAPGFRSFGRDTGVMTLSAATPLTECDLVEHEPWLKTPKAMLVTRYPLAGLDATLLVINIHGVNFSIGMRELQRQLAAAEHIIAAHQGPVLFAGDFNTWRGARMDLIEETVSKLGLTALEYDTDHRKRFFGRPLDHIYVRGLDAVAASTYDIDSSDHNPMRVELRLLPGARVGAAQQ
jgi:endonuclease/exonuclease/phosphatase (EEP) superfamily protein YafD